MANLTPGQLRAKYPPGDRAEYDRGYAATTLAGLARRMGTTQSSIARIEGGGSLPALDMLAHLAPATGTARRLAAPSITGVGPGGAA